MKTVIRGAGEVGKALALVLAQYNPLLLDLEKGVKEQFEILHICFPYYDESIFLKSVSDYQEFYNPRYTVIHSTVPVGTSRKVGAIHSPIRGIHPFLAEGIATFTKLIGGERASGVADYFRRAGLRIMLFDKQETTEAAKLFDTEYYRACIEFAQRVKSFCNVNNLNFHEVYTIPNQSYNDGYLALGHSEYARPVLQAIDGPIGGHCVMPNKELIR